MKIQQHWFKRLLALALVIVTLLQWVPAQAIAAAIEDYKSNASFTPGDVNDDGVIDAKDVNLMRRYIAGGYNVTINEYAADVNADGEIDAKDVNLTRRHIAGGYNVELQPAQFTVSFYDGDRLIDTLTAVKGQPLGEVPSVEKSSKATAILVGYYTDPECTQPFYAENPVTSDMKVYAKYEEMGSTEELTFTSFAQMDQQENVSFEIVGTGDPAQAVTLEVMDGSAPVELSFTATADGYTVYAPEGFNEGASYQLTLADGWNFKDKPDTIRTASFSIYMDEVENLEMNEDIVYIKDTDSIVYTIGGQPYDVLTSGLITENGGSFTYAGAGSEMAVGDIICLYVGTNPEERVGNSDVLDPAVYVKVGSISGDTVTFTQLSEEDQQKLYKLPQNFPIIVDALPTGTTGTVNISNLDKELFAMTGEGYTEANALAKAKEAIAVGDFVSMYVSRDSNNTEEDIYFGEVTGYNAATGDITYKKTTKQELIDSMDLFANIDLDGEDLVSEEKIAALESTLYTQVRSSGFAEDAAFLLADMVTKTDGFRGNPQLQDLLITDANGTPLTDDQIELLNVGGTFELTDDVEFTVELINKGEQLHFEGGVQLAIGIEAEFEVELESEDKIMIELSATFVQEVVIDPKVDGEMLFYEIAGVPFPNGVKVGASIDIKNFTAFSFEAVVYTVEAESELGWDAFKAKANAFIKDAGIQIPDELKEGISTVKDLVNKAKELEAFAGECKDNYDKYTGYMEDAATLWAALEDSDLATKEEWLALEESFGTTHISSELMDMMNLSRETGLSTEYYDSVQALMDRYCEMLEQESDWVTLVEQEIFQHEVNYMGLVIGIETNFVVRADLSIAIGSNLQYEVGKRYEFWFKIGLFKPSAGSSTMDLLDESFAFQFYVMGRLGLRAGIEAKLYFALGTGDVASVGIYAELGPYVKIYGFFVYENTKYRPANTDNWITNERMMGAMHLEFGLYFILGFEAEALGLFEYSYDFLDEEYPLLTAGDKRYYYDFAFAPAEDEVILVDDVDDNSTNGITMKLPDNLIGLKYVNLTNGLQAVQALDYSKYNFTLSNPNFKFDAKTGDIIVTAPEGTRYMECDLIATYKYGKMAFSTYDMTVTIPLAWTNLSTEELDEYYTASVRVGNDEDGYETVWTQRVLKDQEFDLPTVDELKDILGWNDYKYVMGTGYGSQQTAGLTIIEDEVYDFNIDYKTYSITVNGIQNADGTTTSKTYYADFGEMFSFDGLGDTGTANDSTGVFTKFSGLNVPAGIDPNKAIDTRMAAVLANGANATAEYMDNSVTATFTFVGIDADEVTVKLRRGDIPALTAIDAIVADYGMAIEDIYPAIGAINGSTTYQVICGELKTAPATITFQENGGSDVADITKPYGSIIGALPTPEKTGYTFAGWYTDEGLTQYFELTKMPEGGATLYAKWTANKYTVTFHVNGGNELGTADASKTVTYGETYGTLPEPTRTGFGFAGWFTAATGGTEVTANTVMNLAEDHTLYAQWAEQKDIARNSFDFAAMETFTYEKGVTREPVYTFASGGETYKVSEFTFKFMRQGNSEYETGLPVNAGTYDVVVSRPADGFYSKFEETYTAVLTINKAVRPAADVELNWKGSGFTWIEFELSNGDGGIYDLNENATVIFNAINGSNVYSSDGTENVVRNIEHSSNIFNASVTVIDPNYEDWTSNVDTSNWYLKAAPTTSWADYADTSWYNTTDTEFTITTAAQLAGLAKLVNGTIGELATGNSFAGKTIMLGSDIDLSDHWWVSIGWGDLDNEISGIPMAAPFSGVFDGCGYTISGLYMDYETNACERSTVYYGLFGVVAAELSPRTEKVAGGLITEYYMDGTPAIVENVILDDSYIGGYGGSGGIVGRVTAKFVGTKASLGHTIGVDEIKTTIRNCVNYAVVTDIFHISKVGGIAGIVDEYHAAIYDCVNYGRVTGDGAHAGGIVGYTSTGKIINNANFGPVSATSKVGGIVGTSEDPGNRYGAPVIQNNYNMGQVTGATNEYIGGVVGIGNYGEVSYNYYREDCATGADGKIRDAVGSSAGSVDDATSIASSFTSPESQMNGTVADYAGLTLVAALNEWVATNDTSYEVVTWEATGPDGYPLPMGSWTSSLRED